MAAPRTKSSATRTLTAREINRATLARQMLLARHDLSVPSAVERLVALQAQLPGAPYVALWTRLTRFERGDLATALEDHTLVRATFVRGTLHVTTATDFAHFRPTLQPMLSRGMESVLRGRSAGLDVAALTRDAQRALAKAPLTFEQIRADLAERYPKLDVRAMGYAVRMQLPLVQTPGKGGWGFPTEPSFALAETWVGRSMGVAEDLPGLALRYLAAFGPAAARDVQTWSGVQGMREVFETLRPTLRTFHDESGRELFDLPDGPLPPEETPAPPRFLPEFDNVMLGHTDRARCVPEAFRTKVFLSALRVRATVLIDGWVRAGWKVARKKQGATLEIEPFATIGNADRTAMLVEGERLVRFVAPEATTHDVKVVKA